MKENTDEVEEVSYETECFMNDNINSRYKRFPIRKEITVEDFIEKKGRDERQ